MRPILPVALWFAVIALGLWLLPGKRHHKTIAPITHAEVVTPEVTAPPDPIRDYTEWREYTEQQATPVAPVCTPLPRPRPKPTKHRR